MNRIKVELEDRVWEACRLVKGMREICFVLETPEVPDIPAEVFPVLELACDRIVSLLTETVATHNEIGKEST